jgi:iron complex outermembrane receptor protein
MRHYALLVLLFSSITSLSQNCDNTLTGKVTDIHDGQMLVGVTLTIANTEQSVQTGLDGIFTFSNLCNDTYYIQVSHPYCLTKGFRVRISGDTNKSFKLEHHIEELNQITIEGKAYSNKSKTVLESSINKEELERFSTGTLGNALNSLSGVSSLNTGNGVVKPIINGLHSSRVVIMNNGVRMEDQRWGAEHAPNIDINSAGNLTLIKGAAALQYSGDATGGIIIVEAPRIAVKDTLFGKTSISGISNGRGISINSRITKSNLNGWYTSIQGSLKRTGDTEASNYLLSNTGVFEQNASIKFGFNRFDYGIEAYYSIFKNQLGILRASHLGGAGDQVRGIASPIPLIINDFSYDIGAPRQDVTHHLGRVIGYKELNRRGKLSFQYDYQKNNRLEYDIRRGDDRNKAYTDLELITHTLQTNFETNKSNAHHIKTGIIGRYQKNYPNPGTGIRRIIPDYTKYDLGAYAMFDTNINESLIIEIGGRFDYTHMNVYKFYRTSFWESRNYDSLFPEIVVEELGAQILTQPKLNYYNSSATLGATYSFKDNYKLFFNYSLASRAPNPSELFSEGLHHSASRIELGDLRFNSEVGHKFALTLQNNNKNFSFSMQPYINTINDFIVIEPVDVRQTIRGNFQVWEYRQTNAQLIGVDIDASYPINEKLKLNHQFSLVKGYDRSKDEPLINMPPANFKNEIVYKNSEYNNLRISLQSAYVFRQNEFPNNNFEVYIPQTETNEIVDFSTPPNAYHLLNFNSSIDFKTSNKTALTVGLEISNLLNTSYRNYLSRLRFYADDLGRNFLLTFKLNY